MTASALRTVPPNPKSDRTNPQNLDRPTIRGTYLQPGSILDENPGSDLSGNQQSMSWSNWPKAQQDASRVRDGVAAYELEEYAPLLRRWDHQAPGHT
jgi:hypothetical protein